MQMLKVPLHGKKGIDIQFNWVFVLIAGTILLVFFLTLIYNTINEGKEQLSESSQDSLAFAMRTSLGSPEGDTAIKFTKKVIFSCNEGVSQYGIEGFKNKVRYDYNVVFSPKSLEGNDILVKISSFKIPFAVMPFLYLTNREVQYVFLGDDPILSALYNSLPVNATRKYLLAGDLLSDNNFDQVVLVSLSPLPPLSQLLDFVPRKDSVFAVHIEPSANVINGIGNVTFYRLSGNVLSATDTLPYFGKDLLLGSVVSHDAGLYTCQLQKVMPRIGMMANLTLIRLNSLSLGQSQSCIDNYNLMSPALITMISSTKASPPAYQDLYALFSQANVISSRNTALAEGWESCIPLY